jgi:hypothetical protein
LARRAKSQQPQKRECNPRERDALDATASALRALARNRHVVVL